MDLISCDSCGVVLDKNKLIIPDIWDHDGEFQEGNSYWDGDNFIPIITCPSCSNSVKDF